MTVELNALVERVAKLESQNRSLKRWGIGFAALAGAVTLCSAAAAVCDVVSAERFVLRDTSGRERAVLTAYETRGVPQFSLLSSKGQRALTLGVAEDGRAYIEVAGADGKQVRSHFAIGAEGNATIESPASKPIEPKKDDKVSMRTR